MFQRIRGAIDARIAEEQARQKSGQEGGLSRSNSAAHRGNASTSRPRARREGSNVSNVAPIRGPDPAEFDPEFVVGDDDSSMATRSGTGTPALEGERAGDVEKTGNGEGSDLGSRHMREKSSASLGPPMSPTGLELPTEARVKLRRLDKLEGRYQELLKAYKTAHARVISIEPFEAALRENTPLTSIGDPRALTEYLNQITLKGDMVIAELKRVTAERDDYKKKAEESEKSAQEAIAAVEKFKREGSADTAEGKESEKPTVTTEDEVTTKSPAASIATRTASMPGLSLLSPKSKSAEPPQPAEGSEEFFSFDNEIPRLESELKEREEEVNTLKTQVKSLAGDLHVARESTGSMAQSLEEATRELHGLREGKDRSESDKAASREKIKSLESKLASFEGDLDKSNAEIERLKSEIQAKAEELEKLEAQKGSQKGTGNKKEQKAADERRLNVLQGIVDNLKSQLKEAETTVSSLKEDMTSKEAEAKNLQQIVDFVDTGLKDNDKWKAARESVANGKSANFDEIRASLIPSEAPQTAPANSAAATTASAGGGKRKNKKKKKGGKAAAEEPTEASTLPAQETPTASSTTIVELEQKIEKLTSEIEEKEAAIERLHSKLKGEEDLREEIDSLRDDLLNLGQQHVEGRDKIKELLAQKTGLEQTIEGLEKEIVESKTSASKSADTEKAHEGLTQEFEDLKIKATALETDLNAAQQLAASRFKDVTDLREALQKIQPELRNLRSESAEWKATKEELKNKAAELNRLERRNDDLRADIKSLQVSIREKDADMKTLNQKIGQETNSRLKAEQALDIAQSDLRYSEGKKQEVTERNERTLRDLSKTQEELRSSRASIREVEEQAAQLNKDVESLRDEIQLKTAQYASAQSLMNSMRDQMSEMAMQVKEARERCESLEEEVSETHRLLSERAREGETMRRLLSDVEMRSEIKVREIKERLDTAIEERDKAEEEASTIGRRKAREMEELKVKAREAERALRRAEEDKEELEHAQGAWKRRREDLEAASDRSEQELADIKQAMAQLRDALDESEKQVRELESERNELRRSVEETSTRLDKLRRSNKNISEDLRSLQSTSRLRGTDRSARSSMDSSRRGGVSSPAPMRNGSVSTVSGAPAAASVDHVYLKNVFLQFLEQKDKNYQKQLIPVLGNLLQFDSTDEQKWMSAISSR